MIVAFVCSDKAAAFQFNVVLSGFYQAKHQFDSTD